MDGFGFGNSSTSGSGINLKSQATFKILRRLHGHNLENEGLNNLSEAFQNFVTRAKFFSIGKLRRTWSHSAVEFMKYRRLLPMIVGDEFDQGSVFDQFIDIGSNGLPSTAPHPSEFGQEERRILVSNVSGKATKTQLQSFFNKFGKVQSCHIPSDKNRGESNFYATMPKRKFYGIYVVTFKKAQFAQRARKALAEELIFYGQQMVVRSYISSGRIRSTSNQEDNNKSAKIDCEVDFNIGRGQLSRTSSASSLASTGTTCSCSTLAGPFNGLQLDGLPERPLALVLFHVGPINRIRLERVNKRWLEAAAKAWSMCHNLRLHDETTADLMCGKQPKPPTILLRALLRRSGPHLHSLNLSGVNQLLDEKTISDIGAFCPNLVELNLSGIAASPETLRALTESAPKLTKVTYCNMAHTNERTFWFMFKAIASKIKLLNLSGCIRLKGTFFKLFGTELETLLLDGCISIDDNVIEDICARCNSVRTLKLDGCRKLTDGSLSLITRHLSELSTLTLCGEFSKCSAEGFYQIARIGTLQKLCLDYNPIVDDNLLIALANGLPQLHEISLAFAGTDKSIGRIGLEELAKFNRLTNLDLSGLAALNGEIFEKICANCLELSKLTIRNCIYLNDAGVEELKNLNSLELVDLSGCILISNESVGKLCNTFKQDDEKPNFFQPIVLVIGGTICEPHKIRLPRNSRVILDHFDKSTLDLTNQFKWLRSDAAADSAMSGDEDEEDDFKILSAHRDFIAGALQTEEEESFPSNDPKLIVEWAKKEATELGLLEPQK